MKVSFAIFASTFVSSTWAFAPPSSQMTVPPVATSHIRSTLFMSDSTDMETSVATTAADDAVAAKPAPLGPTLNGWTPDASKPCFGLPGAIAPLGYFDPLGFCKDRSLDGVKRFREAEVLHARVAMMATVGYLIGENTPTITYGFDTPTIANNQIPEVSFGVLFPFFLIINIVEALRAAKGTSHNLPCVWRWIFICYCDDAMTEV
jgi:hypothetical protein